MADRIKLRRDTAANWTATNPVLAQGEPGFETDTDFLKVGDGVTAWNSLGYVAGVGAFVSKTGDTMTGPLSVPAGASGAQVPQAQETYGPKNGQLAGMRNKIINGAFGINQRNYVSGAATTAGQYTLDRWKVTGTGGITFSTANNKTTVTIPSGQTLQQVIEGLNLQTGTYVLSWEGTAQGRIAGGTYGASGSVTASITGGVNTTIEFNAGTVANVQFELGIIATPFEHRPYGAELAMCQRYFEYVNMGRMGLAPLLSITVTRVVKFNATKRIAPTVTCTVSSIDNASAGNGTVERVSVESFVHILGVVNTGYPYNNINMAYSANAEL